MSIIRRIINWFTWREVRRNERRVNCCELCGSVDQVKRTADPDRGGLQLCAACRRLFGFEGVGNGN